MNKLGNNVTMSHVYKKTSSLAKPDCFWGLTRNRLDQLKNEGEYYVRFDYPQGSIVLTDQQIDLLLADKSVASDGDYKIKWNDLTKLIAKLF